MNILFYGFRHGHIDTLYKMAKSCADIDKIYCIEEDENARKAASERLGITFEDVSLEKALAEYDIDAVAVGARYGDRGSAAIKAMTYGKHIIADKPLCTSLSELSEIECLSREKDLKIACMLDLRYMPSAITAKKLYDSGKYGKLVNISFDGQHCIDYVHRPSWYFEKGMHGGTINDLGIHGVDLVSHIFGEEFVKIDYAETRNKYAYDHDFFRDCAMFVCTLTSGAKVMADVSYSAPANQSALPTYWQFRCWLERAMMIFSVNSGNVTVYDNEGKCETFDGIVPESTYLEDFLKEISSGTKEFTDSVIKSTRSCLEIQKAAEQNIPTSCDVGNDD